MKACVLGLGEVGIPTAKYVGSKGIDVFGYDIKTEAIQRAKEQGIEASSRWQEAPASDIYIICVYAGLKNDDPDFSSIFDVCEKIREKTASSSPEDSLVSIESTVIPGLCRKVYADIFKKQVKLIHVPHRFFGEEPAKHGVRQRRVIGAINDESFKRGWSFYKKLLGIPLHKVSTIETAEMSKVAEQTFRYVQIAFAEELKMVCDKIGMNFNELRRACNTKWNIDVPEARDGIKGHCLPKDSRYFLSLTNIGTLVSCARKVDETYKNWISRKQ